MKYFLYSVFALAAVVLTSCSFTPLEPTGNLGERYKSTIPGIWSQTVKSGSESMQMVKAYRADGTASGVLLMKSTRSGVSIVMPEIRFESRWRIVGDICETYDVRASAPGMFKRSDVIRDQLISVKSNRIVARASQDGEIRILDRLNPAR